MDSDLQPVVHGHLSGAEASVGTQAAAPIARLWSYSYQKLWVGLFLLNFPGVGQGGCWG